MEDGVDVRRKADRDFARGLARALAGAILFTLPLLMTMEMWSLGFSLPPLRLALLLALTLPLLAGLAYFSGFEETVGAFDSAVDALVAFAVACVASALVLALFGVLRRGEGLQEWVGTLALQAVPGSVGAVLAQSQLGVRQEEERKRREGGYAAELFFMGAGALYLAMNVAPTEEMVLIAYKMAPGLTLLLAAVSLLAMHAFVYAVEFRGQEPLPEGHTHLGAFLRFSVVGYALVLGICAGLLWTFGRFEGTAWPVCVQVTVVLGLPASVGAAAARLIL